jgi:hypothetical protein
MAQDELEPSGLRHWHGMDALEADQQKYLCQADPPGRSEGLVDEIGKAHEFLEMARSGKAAWALICGQLIGSSLVSTVT